MSDLSNFLENEVLDHILGTTSWAMPTGFWSLHSGHPGETGANELSGGSYARQSIAFGAAVAGVASNTALEQWDLTGVTGATIYFLGYWDAVSGGNFLWAVPLVGTPATFTGANTGDVNTSYGHALVNDDRAYVKAASGSALPAGYSEDTLYFVVGVTANTFQLSLTQGGAAVAITADGEGIAVRVTGQAFTPGNLFQVAIGDLDMALD